jgi:hypothetical protein
VLQEERGEGKKAKDIEEKDDMETTSFAASQKRQAVV